MKLKALCGATTLSFSVALAGAAFAQGTPPSQPGTPRPSTPSMDGQTVTVTGCLVKASDLPGASAATGTPPASAAGDFALANVQMRSTSPGGTTAAGTTAGGTATTPAAPAGKGMNLKLTGSDSAKLSEHVNKEVEVTGRLSTSGTTAGSAAGTTGTTGTTATTPAAAARSVASGMGQLQVQSIRPTGQSCTASGQ